MYLPKGFQESDSGRLLSLIERWSFGTLIVGVAPGDLEISHLPFLVDRDPAPNGSLLLHVARANPIWKRALETGVATAVFSGPHAYVSASWYEHPSQQVPTWNYAVVHATGKVEGPIEGPALTRLVARLTEAHEGERRAWGIGDLDRAVHDELIQAIVGLSIRIDRLDGKLKLSQNRSPEDRARVIRALGERGTPADLELASLMQEPRSG